MTDFEKNELHNVRLIEAYLEAGADLVINRLEDIKKVIDNIALYKVSRNQE